MRQYLTIVALCNAAVGRLSGLPGMHTRCRDAECTWQHRFDERPRNWLNRYSVGNDLRLNAPQPIRWELQFANNRCQCGVNDGPTRRTDEIRSSRSVGTLVPCYPVVGAECCGNDRDGASLRGVVIGGARQRSTPEGDVTQRDGGARCGTRRLRVKDQRHLFRVSCGGYKRGVDLLPVRETLCRQGIQAEQGAVR